MAEPLRRTQAVRLTHDERENLRNLAQRNGLSSGILARALLLWARANISPQELESITAAAKKEVAARASAAGTAAVNHRWSMTKARGDN